MCAHNTKLLIIMNNFCLNIKIKMFLSQQKFWNDLQWDLGTHFDKWARTETRYHYFHIKFWPPCPFPTLTYTHTHAHSKKGGRLTSQISFQHLSHNITGQIIFQFVYKNFQIPFSHWLPRTTYKTNTIRCNKLDFTVWYLITILKYIL